MNFIAHINDTNEIQSVKEHCIETAQMASSFLQKNHLNDTAYLVGLFHDAGKCTDEFTDYILKNHSHEEKSPKKGSVIHTFAGTSYFLKKYRCCNDEFYYKNITAEIIATSIGSHHGLLDLFDENHKSAFEHRLKKQPQYDKKAISNFLPEISSIQEVELCFNKSVNEIINIITAIDENLEADDTEYQFYIGMLCRLLTSTVIDADRLDTMYFMTKKSIPHFNVEEIFKKCKCNLETHINRFEVKHNIDVIRRKFSDICGNVGANNKNGIFRLNIPTGGGKTLSGIRFAINHALNNKMDRIIYVSPLLSILEQNAKSIRDALDFDDIILEHHSNIINDTNSKEIIDKYDIMTESWNAPIIITTLVQFLNTIFKSKTASVRRFHSLCNSVIIIDEVQSVPVKMLSMFNLAMNFLTEICGATVVLCSATQPGLDDFDLKHRLNMKPINIIPDNILTEYSEVFHRNTIIDKGKCKIEDIADIIVEQLDIYSSILIVCNTKKESEYLYNKVVTLNLPINLYHLSASMCIQHRRDVIDDLKDALHKNEKVVCISTQVIEAGVDISFECAFRISAGIDNIVQVAGRVNRNGEKSSNAPVYILNCLDERLSKLKDITNAQKATLLLLESYKIHPELYSCDLSSEKSIKQYYKNLYANYNTDDMDYPINRMDSLLEMLSTNTSFVGESEYAEKYYIYQAFKTAGDLFKVLDDNQKTVIVPYGKAVNIIPKFYTDRAHKDLSYLYQLIEELKPYTISLFQYQIENLEKENAIDILDERIFVLNQRFYSNQIGFTTKKKEDDNPCAIQIL